MGHVSFRHVSFRHVSLRLVSLRLVSLRLVSLRLVSLRLVSLRLVSLRLVALRHVTLGLVTFGLVAMRLITLGLVARRLAAAHARGRLGQVRVAGDGWLPADGADGGVQRNDLGSHVNTAVALVGIRTGDSVCAGGSDCAGGHGLLGGGRVLNSGGGRRRTGGDGAVAGNTGAGGSTRGRSRGGSISRGRSAGDGRAANTEQSILGNINVVAAGADKVLSATAEVPEGHTTPAGELTGGADEGVEVLGLDVAGAAIRVNGGRASRETEEELGVLALGAVLNDLDPIEVVDAIVRVELALRVVVELDEQGIELSLIDQVGEVEVTVVGGALRSSRDEERWVQLTEGLDHGNVATVVELGLDIEVKTVNGRLGLLSIEGTRAGVAKLEWTEGLVQELGKLNTVLLAADGVVVGAIVVVATDAEQNLDAALLAVRDILLDGGAVAQ